MTKETRDRPKCRCGQRLVDLNGVALCANCDQLQQVEVFGRLRRRTAEDIRFELSWAAQIEKEYGPLPEGETLRDLEGW